MLFDEQYFWPSQLLVLQMWSHFWISLALSYLDGYASWEKRIYPQQPLFGNLKHNLIKGKMRKTIKKLNLMAIIQLHITSSQETAYVQHCTSRFPCWKLRPASLCWSSGRYISNLKILATKVFLISSSFMKIVSS